ncbi:MAG: sugar phosphate isomerase/epimerase [Clostridia bacterium]|nr:sugar phosphate isomerase/epimerase [Clostridia bacterium]
MKLSIWTSYYWNLSAEDALLELKAHGFNYCELSCEHAEELIKRGEPKSVGEAFGSFARENKIAVLQGHLSFVGIKISDPENRAIIKKQLDLFNAIGIKSAVLHLDPVADENGVKAPVDVARKANVEALSDILEYIKGTDIVVCLENLITSPAANTVEGLMYYIEHFNSKNLGICLDTGHLNINGKDHARFIKTAKNHIKALHLADNEGQRDQHMMPYGRGNVDFETVIRETKAINYQGLYNLEIPGEVSAPQEVRGYKLDYIQKIMAYLDKVTDK